MKKLSTLFLATGLALGACGGKKETKNEPPAAGSGSGAMVANGAGSDPATGSGSAATGSGSGSGSAVDIPTEIDFEAQATQDITDKTVDDKVKQLEADLGP
ncbi:MAG TPA: hypothetical protein VGM90_03750 [Kofleriaceae bacterium]